MPMVKIGHLATPNDTQGDGEPKALECFELGKCCSKKSRSMETLCRQQMNPRADEIFPVGILLKESQSREGLGQTIDAR